VRPAPKYTVAMLQDRSHCAPSSYRVRSKRPRRDCLFDSLRVDGKRSAAPTHWMPFTVCEIACARAQARLAH